MKLHIGILGKPHPGWTLLMEQEGVSYSFVETGVSPQSISVLIIGDDPNPATRDFTLSFLKQGGSVLCSGDAFESLSGKCAVRTDVKYLLPRADDSLRISRVIDLEMECNVPADANEYLTNSGMPAVFSGEFGGGHLVALPFAPQEAVLDTRSATRTFYAFRKRLPFERVSAVSKGGIRLLVSHSLELLHHRRGLPYVRKSSIPNNAPSVFALRIDTDYANRKMIEDLAAFAQRKSIPLTWFVDVGSQKGFLDVFAGYQNDEVGIHCFDHVSYPDGESNLKNIRKALAEFDRVSLSHKSFAAPYGAWNDGIAGAVQESRFVYSSEFSYDYDNLPSHARLNGLTMESLQLPVHPISIGSMRRQGFSSDEMKTYFDTVAERAMALYEPLFVYHHPGDGHPEVLEHLVDKINDAGISGTTMINYAEWWDRREAVSAEIDWESDRISIRTKNPDASVGFRITTPDGRESFFSGEGEMNLSGMKWQEKPALPQLAPDYARIRKFNPWVPLIRFEDMIAKIRK